MSPKISGPGIKIFAGVILFILQISVTASLSSSSSLSLSSLPREEDKEEILALGRIASIGSLYDARTLSFPGFSALPTDSSSDSYNNNHLDSHESSISNSEHVNSLIRALHLIETTKILSSSEKIQRISSRRPSERFKLINPKARPEEIVGVLVGSIPLDGSSSFLEDDMVMENYSGQGQGHDEEILYWLKTVLTVKENLRLDNKYLPFELDFSTLSRVPATHIVVGSTFGAGIAVRLQFQQSMHNNNNSNSGNVNSSSSSIWSQYSSNPLGKMPVHIYSDVPLSNNTFYPDNLQAVKELMKNFPGFGVTGKKAENEARGKPLAYTLVSIKDFLQYFNFSSSNNHNLFQQNNFISYRNVDPALLQEIVHIFDEISMVQGELHELQQNVESPSHRACISSGDIQNLEDLQHNFQVETGVFKRKLRTVLNNVRCGLEFDFHLQNFLQSYKEGQSSPYSYRGVRTFLQDSVGLRNTLEKIRFVDLARDRGISFLGRGASFHDIEFDMTSNSNNNNNSKSDDNNFGATYLLYIKNFMDISTSEDWLENRGQFFNLGENALNSTNNNGGRTKTKNSNRLYIIDCDLALAFDPHCRNLSRFPVIHEYQRGRLISRDYVRDLELWKSKDHQSQSGIQTGAHYFSSEVGGEKNLQAIVQSLMREQLENTTKLIDSLQKEVAEARENSRQLLKFQNRQKNLNELLTKELLKHGDVIFKPKARLFSGFNFTGEFEDFNYGGENNPDCFDLTEIPGQVKSIETFGTCVRLYTKSTCLGQSMAYYSRISPETGEDLPQANILKGAYSIGSCFDNELDFSSMDWNSKNVPSFSKKKVRRDHFYVPDSVFVNRCHGETKTGSSPIEFYSVGYKGRVECIWAQIHYKNVLMGLRSPAKTTLDMISFYNDLEKEATDVLGVFVSGKLGVQQRLPFNNVFPQERGWNKRMWEEREVKIVNYLNKNRDKGVQVHINVDYELKNSTRPTGLSYFTYFNKQYITTHYVTNLASV